MSSEVAIKVENLNKCYQIYNQPTDRLRQFILPRLHNLLGQPPKSYFREFWALQNISFEIKKGETVGIIGRNGSGKSTLLQMICGTLNPTSGSIQTKGRIAALLELGSGFNPEFTGRENVYLNAAVLGLNKKEIDERFNDIVAFADIGDFIEQPTKTYSSGMVVRLAFAVIAHVDADILVIDEALSVGDAFFVQKCMRFLRKFMEQGTVLFVSHDTGAVLNLCEKAIWLHKGVIEATGNPKDVAAQYLVDVCESQQGVSARQDTTIRSEIPHSHLPSRDMRLDFINQTAHRNDIELFAFTPDTESFGKGGATIVSVLLQDQEQQQLSWIVGGEPAALNIQCIAHTQLFSPIVGFMVKDRLGQVVFADNTYLSCLNTPLALAENDRFSALFRFHMPLMPTGDYTISVSVAEGTQLEHIQHHWLHDAIAFKVHSSSTCLGLIGIPMQYIGITKL